jgi:hypothetical protein
MSKLFRKARQSFLSDGSTSKYFKYAIGEILLVVVGILLALQVSNWNQNAQQEKRELQFLEQIGKDLTGMLEDIESDLYSLQLGDQGHFKILDYIENNLAYQDTLCFDFYWLIKDEYIYPVRATYDAVKEEGMAIIQNEKIRRKIQSAFENLFPRISKTNPFYPDIEEFFSAYYQENFTVNTDVNLVFEEKFPYFVLKYPYPKVVNGKFYPVTIGFVPKDFDQLKKDDRFRVLMRQAYRYRSYKMNRYNSCKTFVKALQKEIEEELAQRK